MKKQNGSQALERGLGILEAVAEAPPEGLRLTEIAAMCELEQPTAHRLVAALERAGYLARVGDSRRLRLGLRLFQLGSIGGEAGGLADVARPALIRLAAATGDCMFLMVRSGLDAVCLDRQDATYTIHSLTGHVGGATPLGLGTGSMTILAHLPEAERHEVREANRERIRALRHDVPSEAELALVRDRGFYREVNRSVAGIVGAAVPILTPRRRPIAAIAIGATEARLPDERLPAVIEMMEIEARRIEAELKASPSVLASS
ncbi:IclR family transcriptional regulator [Ancylobacter mangrovi]|uniref:IclR family transcriptional regulator n=1 Tax=Ancylobacter mangrovi TaxID=2972472 RepID=UPI0021629D84|nr:IclR family transcriptional regulator [Ancylobacter mangrovi]MCS0505179.1 IclR family transcriptional regulator [Ancylobacter mangrovi]